MNLLALGQQGLTGTVEPVEVVTSIKQATCTPQPLYSMVLYNTVLDITRISAGPQMVIKDLFSYITIHFTLVITLFG